MMIAPTDARSGLKAETDKPGLVPASDAAAVGLEQGVAVAGMDGDEFAGAPTIEELKRMLDSSRTACEPNSKLQRRDRDYYDGHGQLNSEVRNILKARGQPPIYTNRIRPAIDGVLGVLDGAQTDPRAFPRNPHPSQENAADVATKALRYIADKNDFAATKLDCAEEHQIEGSCAAIVEFADDEIIVTQIPWKDFFADPRSRQSNYLDARYLGAAKWMYADDVKEMYPERYRALGDPVGGALATDLRNMDNPESAMGWVDQKQRRLMIAEVYYRKAGEWFRCVFCASGIFEWAPSAYQDDRGASACPIVAESCYIDRDYQRYGRVRDMVPIQDEINARRSRLLHLSNARQIQEREMGASVVDADTARAEAARADGIIPAGWQMVPTADIASGQQLLLGEAKSEIERMGPTPAVLGRTGGASQSGRAKQVLEQAGLTELARSIGRVENWEVRCYQHMWARAKQFWTDPKWIRVTDDPRAPQFLQINAQDGQVDEQGQPVPTNRIAEMDMDISVLTVPNTASLQQEVFADFKELVSGGVDPFSPAFELLIEMSPIANKQDIIEKIKGMRERQSQDAQGQQQQQQAMMQAQMEKLTAEIADIKASALAKAAKADRDTQETNAVQATTFATLGPVAASFGIMPDAAGIANMQAAVGGVMPDAAVVPTQQAPAQQAPAEMAAPPMQQ